MQLNHIHLSVFLPRGFYQNTNHSPLTASFLTISLSQKNSYNYYEQETFIREKYNMLRLQLW